MTIHFINLNNFLEREYFSKFCVESWKKYIPEAEIKIWTEKDEFIQKVLSKNSKFLEFFQKDKNYGFLCDYLRLHLQYEFGGIYSELDQMLLKPLKIDEDIEFCHSLIYTDCITTSTFPNYFKKGNKILKYLIDDLDNNFNMSYMSKTSKTLEEIGFNEWKMCLLRNLPNNLTSDLNKFRINSEKFFEENGYWSIHLADWQFKLCKNIILIDEQLYQKEAEHLISDAFFFVFGDIKSYKIDFLHSRYIDSKLKPLFLKFIKYQIYKSPKLKDKIIDVENYLGDINEISEKDFKIDDYTFPKY